MIGPDSPQYRSLRSRPAPVAPGTAEQLARLAYLHDLTAAETGAAEEVAFFLLGHVGPDFRRLLAELRDDCLALYRLTDGPWSDDELDDLSEDEWARSSFPSVGYEIDARWHRTHGRLVADIEGCIWRARLAAAAPKAVAS